MMTTISAVFKNKKMSLDCVKLIKDLLDNKPKFIQFARGQQEINYTNMLIVSDSYFGIYDPEKRRFRVPFSHLPLTLIWKTIFFYWDQKLTENSTDFEEKVIESILHMPSKEVQEKDFITNFCDSKYDLNYIFVCIKLNKYAFAPPISFVSDITS